MKKVLEPISIILFVASFVSIGVAIIIDFKMIVFSVVAFIIGIIMQGIIKVIDNQERIMLLLKTNPNEATEEIKEENRAE